MIEEIFVRGTAQFAVLCYLARLLSDSGLKNTLPSQRASRWWWTVGCVSLLLHALVAFLVVHGGSHSEAFAATARRTAEMTGWNSGLGLYVNEAFLCLWITDVGLWWRNLDWPRNRRIYWSVQGIFGFLMIQATAVFGPPFWKLIALVFAAILLTRIVQRRRVPD